MARDIVQAQNTWFKLSSIVDTACHRLGISVSHYYQRMLELAKWELIQFKMDRANQPKTVLLDISDVNTVKLPGDCIDVAKIGIQEGQFVKTIGINGELSTIDRTLSQPQFSQAVSPGWKPNGTSIVDYGNGFEFLNYGGLTLNAVGGGLPHEGHFQIVDRDGFKEILLDGNIGATQLYVEYIALGVDPCGDTVLSPYIADYVLKALLFLYESEINPRATEASIIRRGREKSRAFTVASGRTNSIDRETLLLTTRRNYRLTPQV